MIQYIDHLVTIEPTGFCHCLICLRVFSVWKRMQTLRSVFCDVTILTPFRIFHMLFKSTESPVIIFFLLGPCTPCAFFPCTCPLLTSHKTLSPYTQHTRTTKPQKEHSRSARDYSIQLGLQLHRGVANDTARRLDKGGLCCFSECYLVRDISVRGRARRLATSFFSVNWRWSPYFTKIQVKGGSLARPEHAAGWS